MSDKKTIVFLILKVISALLIIIMIGSQFMKNKTSNAKFADVEKAVMSKVEMTNIQEGNNQMIKRLYGLDPVDFEEMKLYYPKTNMGAEEVLLVRLKDVNQAEAVKKAMEERRDTQKKSFDGYGTYQYAMLEQSKIDVEGNYILFISAKNPEEIVKLFQNAL